MFKAAGGRGDAWNASPNKNGMPVRRLVRVDLLETNTNHGCGGSAGVYGGHAGVSGKRSSQQCCL